MDIHGNYRAGYDGHLNLTVLKPMSYIKHCFLSVTSLLAGIILAMAFAPFELGYLSVIVLYALFLSWEDVSAAKAAWRGYLFGLGVFGAGVSWVYVSVHDYGHASALSAGLVTAAFVGFWALFPALAGYCAVRAQFAVGHRLNVLVLPLVWVLVEYLRGDWVLNGFPWLQVAYGHIDTPLGGYIPIIGVYGTGFLVALSASLCRFAAKNRSKAIWPITILVSIWLGGGLLKTIRWTHPIGNAFPVALVQGNIPQDQKWLPDNKLKTLQKYRTLTDAHWQSKLIIWPESSIPAYLSEVDGFFITPLEADAQKHGTDLVVSLPLEDRDSEALYNGVLNLGHERRVYKKNHLLPFGEYLPLQPLSGYVLNLLGIKLGNFTSGGAHQPLLKANGYAFATTICYEDVFGDEVIQNSQAAAFLVNVTNDAWFGDSIEPHQHLQMARMRALETGRYLLRATNTGATAIVDAQGKIINQAPLFETAVLTGTVVPMGGVTPYVRIGDTWIMAFLAGGLLVLIVLKHYQQQNRSWHMLRPIFQAPPSSFR